MPAALSSAIGLSTVRPSPDRMLVVAARKRVIVWGSDGKHLGVIRRLLVDKPTGRIACALIGRRRYLPDRELRALPWSMMRYDDRLRAFCAETTLPLLDAGPTWRRRDTSGIDALSWRCHTYFGVRPPH